MQFFFHIIKNFLSKKYTYIILQAIYIVSFLGIVYWNSGNEFSHFEAWYIPFSYTILIQSVIWYLFSKKSHFLLILLPFLFVASLPLISADLLFYVDKIQQISQVGENPYYISSSESSIILNQFFNYTTSFIAHVKLAYGPLWLFMSSCLGYLPFDILYSYRIFTLFFLFASSYVIYLLHRKKSFLLPIVFLSSPIVLYEVALDAHNDILSLFFILLSILFLKKERIYFAFYALLTACLIKYTFVLLIPFFGYYIIKNKLLRFTEWPVLLLSSIVFILSCFLLYWNGTGFFDGLLYQTKLNFAGNNALVPALLYIFGFLKNEYIISLQIIFAMSFAGYIVWRFWKKHFSLDAMILSSIIFLMIFFFFFSRWVMPWYLLIPFSLVFALENFRWKLLFFIQGLWTFFMVVVLIVIPSLFLIPFGISYFYALYKKKIDFFGLKE